MHPLSRARGLAIFLLLLVPSAIDVLRNPDLPRFGMFHDDGIYFVSAKSLADGGGYRIESIPGEPPQTKYPPLYPLLLSLAWRIEPQFPANLQIASWLSWLALPALLWMLSVYSSTLGLSQTRTWILLALIAVNPYIVWFSGQFLTELMFLALLLAAMFLVERSVSSSPRIAAAAGAIGGLAYLTRSAGIVLLAAAFAYLWLKRARRQAIFFAAAMLPFFAAWRLWSQVNMVRNGDPALTYYLDYAGYERYSVHLDNFHLFLWKNVDGLLWGLGSFVLPKIVNSLLLKILAQVIAVAMISGVVRMVRRGQAVLYAAVAGGNALLLIVWHFPPDERFVLPMFPLALAGLFTEMEHFYNLTRAGLTHRDRSQRIAAGMIGAAVATILVGAFAMQIYVSQFYMPGSADEQRARNRERLAAFEWTRNNLPPDASVLAYADPVMYLHTGRKTMRQSIPPALWYAEDHEALKGVFRQQPEFALDHNLSYYYFAQDDLSEIVNDDVRAAILKDLKSNPGLEEVFRNSFATVYRVLPAANARGEAEPHTPPRQ